LITELFIRFRFPKAWVSDARDAFDDTGNVECQDLTRS